MTPTRLFQEAQAIAVCWLHTDRGLPIPAAWRGLHPEDCAYCLWTQDDKMAALDDYNAWVGQAGQRRAFFALPGAVRLRLIHEAQAGVEAG